jgi:hypothetical protein
MARSGPRWAEDGEVVLSSNSVPGVVFGPVLQAGVVRGGVHFGAAASDRVAELPYRFGSVPPVADGFQAREVAIVLIGDRAVQALPETTRVWILTGLGGVGKTQLAADLAERSWDNGEVDLLVWITAASRQVVAGDYARLAVILTGIEDADPAAAVDRLLSWLATSEVRWMVVLDDVQSPSDLNGLWPPSTRHGRVVVTTRRKDAALRGRGRRMVEVGPFTAAESAAYLAAKFVDLPGRVVGAGAVSAALGHLPLALAQAAAYMIDRNLTCVEYAKRFADRRRGLVSLLPERTALPDQHRDTVATAWSLSVEQADALAPTGLAAGLLRMACLMDPNGMPLDVFSTSRVIEYLCAVLGRRVGAEEARDGLRCLARLSLVSVVDDDALPHVRVHALVQRATSEQFTSEDWESLPGLVGDALLEVWPDVERDTALRLTLWANVAALRSATGTRLCDRGVHSVLLRAGRSMGVNGRTQVAQQYFADLRTTAVDLLGRDHPDSLTILNEHAYWQGKAGRYTEAIATMTAVMVDRTRTLGPHHPDTLRTRGLLGIWQGHAGNPDMAVTLLTDLLADQHEALGTEHVDTLTTRGNLAYWRGRSGDIAGAATAFRQLVTDRQRVLGPAHPLTLTARNSLARWTGHAGNTTSAIAEFERVLADRIRILGSDHPDTLDTRSDLAALRAHTGDTDRAVADLEHLLVDRVRVHGPDHLYIKMTRDNLEHWRAIAAERRTRTIHDHQ